MIEHRNGNVYAYRSVRRNGKPRREYLGAGELGRILHVHHHNKTLNRNHRASLERAQRAVQASKLDRANQKASEAVKAVNRLVGDVMTRAGFHRTHRHSWRRKRGGIVGSISAEFDRMTAEQADLAGKLTEWLEDREARADAGDVDAARELYGDEPADSDEFSADDLPPPEPARKKRYASSMPAASRLNLLNTVTKNDGTHDTIAAEMKTVEADLAGPNPTPIVRLLASVAAAAYADWWSVDGYCKLMINNPDESHERYRVRAHRRFLATLRELAVIRRLEANQPTTLKIVSTGPQQVNIGQTVGKAIASD